MAFTLDFDAKNNILRVTLEGRVTDAILVECYAAVARYMATHQPCPMLADNSAVTKFEVSTGTMQELAESAPALPTRYMRVFVAPEDSVYGMARMFQMLGEKKRPNLHVVRTLDEAYSLLRVESPEFRAI